MKTGAQEAQEASDDVSEFTKFIRYFLLAFGGIALFVGAFVIFNTLSITVAQRTREFATLRTIGASRRQVLRGHLEALVIGIVASVLGLLLGFALARGIDALFVALDLDLPTTSQVYAPRTFVVSILIGVVVTVLAGLFPAIRATRVPPIAAVREGAELPRGRLAPYVPYIALVIVSIAVVPARLRDVRRLARHRPAAHLASRSACSRCSSASRCSREARPAGRARSSASLGAPRRRRRLAGARQLAPQPGPHGGDGGRADDRRSRSSPSSRRSSNGMKASNRKAIEDQVVADYVVTSQNGFDPFVAAAGDARLALDRRRAVDERALRPRQARRRERLPHRHRARLDRERVPRSTGRTAPTRCSHSSATTERSSRKDFADDEDSPSATASRCVVPSGQRRTLVVAASTSRRRSIRCSAR